MGSGTMFQTSRVVSKLRCKGITWKTILLNPLSRSDRKHQEDSIEEVCVFIEFEKGVLSESGVNSSFTPGPNQATSFPRRLGCCGPLIFKFARDPLQVTDGGSEGNPAVQCVPTMCL